MYCKKMDTLLKNVTARRIMGKNILTVIIRATKKRSFGRNKNMTQIKKRKRIMYLKRYIMTSSFLVMMHLLEKLNNQHVN